MLMTPGPTAVPEPVRDAMSRELINPDVDPRFREIYDRLTDRLATVYGVDSGGDADGGRDVVALGGEGILGLEAAVASLVEPGTEVLCLSNGLYGEGFAAVRLHEV
ncbi:aminotransferase class V, partial [Halorubrum sp. C3]